MHMDKGKPDDFLPDSKTLDPRQRREMINDLENLSGMLDDEADAAPTFDDLPVLKSFVDPATLGRGKAGLTRPAAPANGTAARGMPGADTSRRFDPSLGGASLTASVHQRQQLRQRTSEIVDELVAAALPRIEAELRARLESEIGQILRQER